MIKATVIAAFYNELHYLKLVLAGFERQTEKNFELIIADDGSNSDIVSKIKTLSDGYSFPIKHVWQEDKGFRKNRILNRAIEQAKSDYLIFVDADCIPHRAFVEGHLIHCSKNTCFTGRRVNLSAKITNQLDEANVLSGFLEKYFYKLITDGLFGNSTYVEKGFYLKNKFLLKLLNKKRRGLLGCNFSLFMEDILKINGFDERYILPSIGEDSDIQFRLELAGVNIKSVNHAAVQYHLNHKLQQRSPQNLELFENIKRAKVYFTAFGLKR